MDRRYLRRIHRENDSFSLIGELCTPGRLLGSGPLNSDLLDPGTGVEPDHDGELFPGHVCRHVFRLPVLWGGFGSVRATPYRIAAFITVAAAIALYIFIPNPIFLFWWGIVVGFGLSGGSGVLGAYYAELFPERVRAYASGFCWNIGRICAVIAPYTIGEVGKAYGLQIGLAITCILSPGNHHPSLPARDLPPGNFFILISDFDSGRLSLKPNSSNGRGVSPCPFLICPEKSRPFLG